MEYTKIDLATATPEEIKIEILRLKKYANEYKNEEQGIKILINSYYGALGNKWLNCYNPDVAESVSLQGQNLIKYAEKVIDHYFKNIWPKDFEIHKKMGITSDIKPIVNPLTIYGDTDSNYVCWDEVLKSCDWQGDPKQFILKLNEYRLESYLNGAFERYAKNTGTVNYQDFELENISEAGIWLAKKKYLLNVVWESGIDIDPLKQIIFKGIELAQSSTPMFAREKLKELIKFIFTKKKELKLSAIIGLLKQYKQEFMIADPEKVSMGRSVGDYNKFILNDSTAFEVASKCPIHVRAAGYYNYMLNQNPKLKQKYEMIKSGDKIKYYHAKMKNWASNVKSDEENVFGYLAGSFPVEFAPEINYDEQFLKTIIDPINRITSAMGNPDISGQLYVSHALF